MRIEIDNENESYSFNFMPLLDAIFLLTIFFILTITIQEEEKILPMNLPVSDQPQLMKIENALIIEIHKSGSYYIKNEPVKETELEEKIKNSFAQGGKEVILVRSERGADIQKVMQLTDIARKLGIEKISFAVKEWE
ncbi:MAG: biopolymer transporter ExbD [Ignavibacteriaceae bacterium]|jgi:biopolymer transport protein ExbD